MFSQTKKSKYSSKKNFKINKNTFTAKSIVRFYGKFTKMETFKINCVRTANKNSL
jgi:hypothetical protein